MLETTAMRIVATLFLFCLSSLSVWAQPLPPPPPNQSIPLDSIWVAFIMLAVGYAAFKLKSRSATSAS